MILDAGLKPNMEITIFTYGDTIYNPGGIQINIDLIKHEEVHQKQQGDTPDEWWARYIHDAYFRIGQETAAYARQYDEICKTVKDRNQRNLVMIDLAGILAGPAYGNMLHTSDAMNNIKAKVHTKR